MLLDELAVYIVGHSTKFAVAPSTSKIPVWKGGFRADQPNTAISLFESGGPTPEYVLGGTISVERPTVQVISRSTKYVTARENAWLVYNMLSVVANAAVPLTATTSSATVNYVRITPNQSPFDMGTDIADRTMISCNYLVEKALS